MKMLNADAETRLTTLRELEGSDVKVPSVVGYRIVQNIHALASALAPYMETRDKIIKKYAKDGITVNREDDPEAFTACRQEIMEIGSLEIDVPVSKFPFKMISDKEFPLKTMFAMEFMIEH